MDKASVSRTNLTQKDLAYDRISENWETFISHFDTNRRIEVLVNDFLGEKSIKGKVCLDVGCGLGYFLEAMLKHGPSKLYACDLAPNLVKKIAQKYSTVNARVADALNLSESFDGQLFDVVVCSEVAEHTPDPRAAINNLSKIVVAGGLLAISVPNRRWLWLQNLATAIGLRKNYEGYENLISPKNFKLWIEEAGFEILKAEGIHTIPFRIFPHGLLHQLDLRMRGSNYPYSFNLAVLARKK